MSISLAISIIPDPDVSDRLIRVLGHSLWQAGVLWFLLRVVRRRMLLSSAARYALHLGAMLTLVGALPVTFVFVGQSGNQTGSLQPNISGGLSAIPSELSSDSVRSTPVPTTPQHEWSVHKSAPTLMASYFVVVSILLLRLTLSVRGARALRLLSEPVADGPVFRAVAQAARAMKLSYTPAVALCSAVTVPSVLGTLRPLLLLPISYATALAPEQIEVLVMHELAHVLRHDHVVSLIQRLIESFLFFNPFIWAISSQLRVDREWCCDDLVVAAGGTAVEYAASLVCAARVHTVSPPPIAGGLALAATGSGSPTQLRQRVTRLLEAEQRVPLRLTHRSALAVVGLWAASLLLLLSLPALLGFASRRDDLALTQLPSAGRLQRLPGSNNFSDWTPLHRAVAWGTRDEVIMLLDKGAQPDLPINGGWTPLHFTACLDRPDVARALLDRGANPNATSSTGVTPLHNAMGFARPLLYGQIGASRAVTDVLIQFKANLDAADKDGTTPLHAAVMNRSVTCATQLVAAGANINAKDHRGMCALAYACTTYNLPMVQFLLTSGADPLATDTAGWSALDLLALRVQAEADAPSSVQSIATLLRQRKTQFALSTAAALGWEAEVADAIANDPTLVNRVPDKTREGWRLLHWATHNQHLAVVQLLLRSRADPMLKADRDTLPIHLSVGPRQSQATILQALLASSPSSVNAVKAGGWSPLHLAVIARNVAASEILLRAGAAASLKDVKGRTALHLLALPTDASTSSHHDAQIVDLLVKNGADVAARDDGGRTPLEAATAAKSDRAELVKALLDHGAEP